MAKRDSLNESRIAELERALAETREKALYFQWLAIRSGTRGVREIDRITGINSAGKPSGNLLEYRIELYKLVHDVSARLIQGGADTLESSMEWALAAIGQFFAVDHAFIALFNDTCSIITDVREWCAEGAEPIAVNYKGRATDDHAVFFESFRNGEPYTMNDIACIQDEVLRANPSLASVAALMLVPMFLGNNLIGVVGFSSQREKKRQTCEDIVTMQTIADLLSSAIERKRVDDERRLLEEQLQTRKYIDSLGTLAGGIAHDINNLLATIKGSLDLLEMTGDNLTERQLEHIERATRACRRTESIIGGIRAFTRGARSDKTAVDVYDVANEAFEMVERLSSPKIGLHIDLVPGRYLVLGNADLLYQVFVNLGMNAAQAIEERGVHAGDYINMTAKHVSIGPNELPGLDPGGYIRINVEDNGVGMTDTVKSRIFEPLFSTKRKQGKGQGLGLAMVHNIIINDHGGAINIDSEYGAGTVFHIYLPDASKGKAAEKGNACETAADLVLVIVDDADVSEFTGEILKMRGYRVKAAASASEGIVQLRKHASDAAAAIIDADIKDSGGKNALEAILRMANGARIVLLTTGEKPLPAGDFKISAVLRKPFTVDTFAHAVRRALDK